MIDFLIWSLCAAIVADHLFLIFFCYLPILGVY